MELVERSLRLLEPLTEEQRVASRTSLLTTVTSALHKLAEVSVPSSLLRKTFTVTAVNGEAPLSTPLNATEPLMIDGLRRAQVFIDGFNHAAQYKPDRSSLAFPSSNQFAYWTLENQTLVIRDSTGLDNYDGPVTIRNAPYVPTLANVPVTLEPLLVEILASYAKPAVVAPADARRGN